MSDIIKETYLDGYPNPVTIECTKKILEQMENSLCKINIEKKKGTEEGTEKGTGFFCYINDKDKKIPVMMTNNHVINEDILKERDNIEVTLYNNEKINIKLDNSRKMYTSPTFDTTIIELRKEEKIKYYLEIDDNYNLDNKNLYIIQYPNINGQQQLSVSYGLFKNIYEKYNIRHCCCTEEGSSGSPILKISDNKVIGIHKGNNKNKYPNFNFNLGTLLKDPIDEFIKGDNLIKKENNKNEINIKLEIKNEDMNKDIYFLDNTDGEYKINGNWVKKNHNNLNELNESNVKLYINNKEKNKYKKYFKPDKEGIYEIKLKINTNIYDCSFMFCNCKNIIELDLSSFNTKNVNNMSYMFYYCKNIKNLYLSSSSFNTAEVTNMSYMFYYCKNIEYLDFTSFNTKKVTNMSFMFGNCYNIKNLDLFSFDTTSVTDMSYMFCNCENMKELNIKSFIPNNVTDMNHMFYNLFKVLLKSKLNILEIISLIFKDKSK